MIAHENVGRATRSCEDVVMSDPTVHLDHVFAANVKARREALNMNKADLARAMQGAGWGSYNAMTVTRTEGEERKVGVAEAHALASVLRTTYDEMLKEGWEVDLLAQCREVSLQLISLSGSVGVYLDMQESLARAADQIAQELPAHVAKAVDEALAVKMSSLIVDAFRDWRSEEAAELERANMEEEGDVWFVYGPRERRWRDRLTRQYEAIKGVAERGVDQEEG